ncbi:MAG TPA: ATP-grasp domain-containing protein [Bacteroidales bacterium]|nr:ATP-grasp domain-containing protein [Bacteroidales bacterium]HNS45671.1 ATP-grasp domain-containing protein [Bacteroidales bacterium]
MNKRRATIGISGLNAIDSPGPGMAVAMGLREAKSIDARIIGLAYESLEPMIYMHDLIDKTYQLPYPSSGSDMILSRLEYVQEMEHMDVIIPNFDAELYSFMKIEQQLKRMGIHMFLPTLEQYEERHKVNLSKFGEKYDILVPHGKAVFETKEVFDIKSEFTFPLLVKGKWYDAYIAYNIEQVLTCFNKISAKWGLPVILQKFVHGSEYNVTGLGDGKGTTVAAVAMRKQYITDKGKAWAGISIDDAYLLELTRKFVSATKWRGAFELEMIKTQDNKYYLLEINPRIPAWTYLAVGVGQNIPEALVRMALGMKVLPYEIYDVGKLFIRYSKDMIVDREEFEKLSMTGEL